MEKLKNLPPLVKTMVSIIQIKDNPVTVIGSSTDLNMEYFNDYDASSTIKKINETTLYRELKRVLKQTDELNDVYFIELKIQNGETHKTKFHPKDNFSDETFKQLYSDATTLIKIDYVLYIDYNFIEFSINYNLGQNSKLTKEQSLLKTYHDLIEDYKQQVEDKNYFKALKRLYSAEKIFNVYEEELTEEHELNQALELRHLDIKTLNAIVKFINSDVGKLYREKSNLQTILLLLQYYKDDVTKQRAEEVLKKYHLRLDTNTINNRIDELDEKINAVSYAFIERYHL